MQDLKVYIAEKLDISKDYSGYNYQPKDRDELKSLLGQLIAKRRPKGDFNDIDTSLITNMSYLFYCNKTFNGDISRWNTSRVEYMFSMFDSAESFNQKLDQWDTKKVTDMERMFKDAFDFNQDISGWNVTKVKSFEDIFDNCPIKEEYKPKF